MSNQGSDTTIRPYQFADFDRDGHLDILYSRYGSAELVFLINNGDETFREAKVFSGSRALALYVGDFSGDANIDVLYTTSNNDSLILLEAIQRTQFHQKLCTSQHQSLVR